MRVDGVGNFVIAFVTGASIWDPCIGNLSPANVTCLRLNLLLSLLRSVCLSLHLEGTLLHGSCVMLHLCHR